MVRKRIEMYKYRQVLMSLRQGDTARQIARSGLMGRKKVSALQKLAQDNGWLTTTELPDDEVLAAALAPRQRASSTISSVEPLREIVQKWVDRDVQCSTIYSYLKREHGFTGSYSAVLRMINSMQADKPPEATVKLYFPPGEAAQVDFGAGPKLEGPNGQSKKTWAFVMTLCYSRHQYVEFIFNQSSANWLGCHRRAFEWFNAVPHRVIIDNAKCAITKACVHDPDVQRAYADCALGYRFKIEPCPPHDPQKKGIVESGVKYVKSNFLPTRSFRNLADLNEQAQIWVMQEAGVRIHGTTRQQPLEMFKLDKTMMLELPSVTPDLGTWHQVKVSRDCHVQFERSLYSVPYTLVGSKVMLRATDSTVSLYHNYKLICTHARSQYPNQRRTINDHLPPNATTFFKHDRKWCVDRAKLIGPKCAEFIDRLLSDRIVERLRGAQGVLNFEKRYGKERLESACQRALIYNNVLYGTIKRILSTEADKQPIAAFETPSVYAKTRFTRSSSELFESNNDDGFTLQ